MGGLVGVHIYLIKKKKKIYPYIAKLILIFVWMAIHCLVMHYLIFKFLSVMFLYFEIHACK